MPLYEYRCERCGEVFERLRRSAEADEKTPCPRCQSEQVQRLLSGFATSGCGSGGGRSRFR